MTPKPPEARPLTSQSTGFEHGWEERRGAAALGDISYPWRATGFEIAFLPGQPGLRGLTFAATRRIEIYVRPDDSHRDLLFTIAHEVGHAVDLAFGTEFRRSEWRRIRGIDEAMTWFSCRRCSDYATPAGDFAEVFAYWLLGPGSFSSQLGPPPSPAQLEELAPQFQLG